MSVIVKYMSKPSGCYNCVFERSDSNSEPYCGLSPLGAITGTEPPEWCPIIEIPTYAFKSEKCVKRKNDPLKTHFRIKGASGLNSVLNSGN